MTASEFWGFATGSGFVSMKVPFWRIISLIWYCKLFTFLLRTVSWLQSGNIVLHKERREVHSCIDKNIDQPHKQYRKDNNL